MRFNKVFVKVFASVFAVLMLFFAGYMSWHAIQRSALEAEIADRRKTLETARGRLARQEYERGKAIAEIPGAVIMQDLLTPLEKASGDSVTEWKQHRNTLKGDFSTIRDAAQDALDRAEEAEARLREARERIEAVTAAAQEP